jgi:hypothetical protein
VQTDIEYASTAEAVRRTRASGDSETLREYHPKPSVEFNELLLFLKPELTHQYPDDRRTFDLCIEKMHSFDCEVVAASVLGSKYLERHRLIEAHYGLINAYSTGGTDALPQDARRRAAEAIRATGHSDTTRVLGAHQVLQNFEQVTADDLLSWHDSASETVRLASGAYAFFHRISDEDVLIIDGFHPAQLLHFYGTQDPIVVLVVRSSARWEDLRVKMCGATNPAKALAGSIRQALLTQKDSLHLSHLDSMRNGIHVSAGPVEAAVEISRYLTNAELGAEVHFVDTSFGAILAHALSKDRTDAIARNDVVPIRGARPQAAFDATEHVDARLAVRLLTEGPE